MNLLRCPQCGTVLILEVGWKGEIPKKFYYCPRCGYEEDCEKKRGWRGP